MSDPEMAPILAKLTKLMGGGGMGGGMGGGGFGGGGMGGGGAGGASSRFEELDSDSDDDGPPGLSDLPPRSAVDDVD
jgi:hypothetical protein